MCGCSEPLAKSTQSQSRNSGKKTLYTRAQNTTLRASTFPKNTPAHMGNLKKKRRLKMNKHKRRKRSKASRHKKRLWG
jgi:hypothetical protein